MSYNLFYHSLMLFSAELRLEPGASGMLVKHALHPSVTSQPADSLGNVLEGRLSG